MNMQCLVKHGGRGGDTFKGLLEKEVPLHYSNVALVDPEDGNPCRVTYRYLENGAEVRVSTRSKRIIPFPVLKEDYILEAQKGKEHKNNGLRLVFYIATTKCLMEILVSIPNYNYQYILFY